MKKALKKSLRNDLKCYLLLLLPIVWFGVFFIFSFFRGLYFSFTDFDIVRSTTRGITFIGFDNYAAIFKDELFWRGMKNSTIWTFVMLAGNNFFGLLMAVLIANVKRGKSFFLAALYWPTLVSAAVGTQVTLLLFKPASDGFFNIIAAHFGAKEPIMWLESEKTSLLSLMMLPFLLGFCMKMMIYYAGIRGIPASYSESASLETNSKFKMFFKITFPLIAPVVFLNVLLSLMEGFRVLAPMQLIAPGNRYSLSVVYYLYEKTFGTNFGRSGQISYSSAIGFILFVIIMGVTVFYNKVKKGGTTFE